MLICFCRRSVKPQRRYQLLPLRHPELLLGFFQHNFIFHQDKVLRRPWCLANIVPSIRVHFFEHYIRRGLNCSRRHFHRFIPSCTSEEGQHLYSICRNYIFTLRLSSTYLLDSHVCIDCILQCENQVDSHPSTAF